MPSFCKCVGGGGGARKRGGWFGGGGGVGRIFQKLHPLHPLHQALPNSSTIPHPTLSPALPPTPPPSFHHYSDGGWTCRVRSWSCVQSKHFQKPTCFFLDSKPVRFFLKSTVAAQCLPQYIACTSFFSWHCLGRLSCGVPMLQVFAQRCQPGDNTNMTNTQLSRTFNSVSALWHSCLPHMAQRRLHRFWRTYCNAPKAPSHVL